MKSLHDIAQSWAREREIEAMKLLSEIITGRRPIDPKKIPMNRRQLGYLASLAKCGSYDPRNKLLELEKRCRPVLKKAGPPQRAAHRPVDIAQSKWNAPWHMDASKLRRELPLHVMRMQKTMAQ